MTDYVNQTRGRGEPLPVVANPPTDSRRWLFLKIDHLQFQDGLTFSESIAPNFEVAPSSQNSRRSISGCRQLVKVRLEFWDAAIFPKSAAFIVRSRGLLQIGGLQFQHGMFSSMHSSKNSRTHGLRRARQHKARVRMFSSVYASTGLVHACFPACTPARASCTHVLRCARQHEPRVRMFFDIQPSTRHMHACSPACTPARASCTHVLRTRLPAETRAAVQRVLRRCLTLVTAVEL